MRSTICDGRFTGRMLAALVAVVAVMVTAGLAPRACADDTEAPSRRQAKPGRPRMEPMPPKAESPPRRPFDEADDGNEPRGAAADNQNLVVGHKKGRWWGSGWMPFLPL